MRIPFFANMKSLQSTVVAPALTGAAAPDSLADVRQLTLDEYSAVSGGPEGQVGDGTAPPAG
jgi:hypothetical protein